jgi:hypothetical protein
LGDGQLAAAEAKRTDEWHFYQLRIIESLNVATYRAFHIVIVVVAAAAVAVACE